MAKTKKLYNYLYSIARTGHVVAVKKFAKAGHAGLFGAEARIRYDPIAKLNLFHVQKSVLDKIDPFGIEKKK